MYGQECAHKDAVEAGNGGGDGAIFESTFLSPDGDRPNAELFREKVAEYSDAAPGDRESWSPHSGDEQRARFPVGFTCNDQQFPGLTAICDTNVRFWRYEDGKFNETDNQWANGAALLLTPCGVTGPG